MKNFLTTPINLGLFQKIKEKPLKSLFFGVVFLASLLVIWDEASYFAGWGYYGEEEHYGGDAYNEDGEGCNVTGIQVLGDIYTYYDEALIGADALTSSEDVVFLLETAEDSPNIQAIILEVDSYGGVPVAAEEIVDTLKNYVTKPVIGIARSGALSAGYWVLSGADYIFASKLSDIGSIGVTQSYVDESVINQIEGYTYNSLSTGKFKDMFDDQKPLTWEERQLIERDLKISHEVFINSVAENRGMDIEKVRKLADGSSMLGEMALEAGLIDQIGGYYEVTDYLFEELGIESVICY